MRDVVIIRALRLAISRTTTQTASCEELGWTEEVLSGTGFMSSSTNGTTTTTTTTTVEVLHVVAAVYLCMLASMGTVGNAFVLATLARMPQMHRITYILVGNLSAVGLLYCLLTIPLHVTHSLVRDASWKGSGEAACKVQAHINYSLTLCTLLNSAAIAVSRYRAVTATHSLRVHTASTTRTAKLLFFFWAVPFLLAFTAMPFFGFNSLMCDCFFQVTEQALWFTSVALAAPALVSTVCMLAAYALIIKKVRDSHLKIANFCHKPISVTDNALQVSREDRTVSESEAPAVARNDVEMLDEHQSQSQSRSQTHAGLTSPCNVLGIEIYTTMVPDETWNVPSTSLAPDKFPASLLGAGGKCRRQQDWKEDSLGFARQGTRDSDLNCLQLPSSKHVCAGAGTELPAVRVGPVSGMDTLSVPSRAVSTLSGSLGDTASTPSPSISALDQPMGKRVEPEGRANRRLRKEVRLTLHLFLAFILFCLLYLPLCFAHALHALHVLRKEAWLIFYTLALSFSSNAWLVYALLNRDFRRAFRALLLGRRSF